ncbi:MAG: hypothetical protein NTX79_01620 [Candidatus Micrarchaeota archaeon]|nr:hypothetical protein [Candidatus Micrarchaeota archaeon]
MAIPIAKQAEKQPLTVAAVGFDHKKLGKSDAQLGAYLRKLKSKAEARSQERFSMASDNSDLGVILNNYAVAKSSGIWMFFRPENEQVIDREKNEYVQPMKYIIARIPEGMTNVGSGNVMIACANARTHMDIFYMLRNAAAFDNGVSPVEIAVPFSGMSPPRWFKLPNGATASVLGGGPLEYVFSREKQSFELFIDQHIFSSGYGGAGPSVMLEVMARINGCQGVEIRYGRYGTSKEESARLTRELEARVRK